MTDTLVTSLHSTYLTPDYVQAYSTITTLRLVIPFRLNNSACSLLILLFTFTADGNQRGDRASYSAIRKFLYLIQASSMHLHIREMI